MTPGMRRVSNQAYLPRTSRPQPPAHDDQEALAAWLASPPSATALTAKFDHSALLADGDLTAEFDRSTPLAGTDAFAAPSQDDQPGLGLDNDEAAHLIAVMAAAERANRPMTRVWIVVGITVIAVVLIGASILPRLYVEAREAAIEARIAKPIRKRNWMAHTNATPEMLGLRRPGAPAPAPAMAPPVAAEPSGGWIGLESGVPLGPRSGSGTGPPSATSPSRSPGPSP